MGAFWQQDRFLSRAFLASIGLHLIFAYFIPAITTFAGSGPAIETLSFVKIIRLSVHEKRTPKVMHAATAPVVATKPSFERHPKPAGKTEAKMRVKPASANVAAQVAAQTAPGDAQPRSIANVAATPSQEQLNVAASNQSRDNAGGYAPFGADNPDPVLDANTRHALGSLGIHVTLTIVVDASGHLKDVKFNPPLASDVQDKIRSMLASASWDAATCGGGIHCEGTTTIAL